MNTLHDEHLDGAAGPSRCEKSATSPIGGRGFPNLHCLSCGQRSVHVRLEEVTTFCCDACGYDWDADEAEANIEAWIAALEWVRLAPPLS